MEVGIDTTRISRFTKKSEQFIKKILTEREYKTYISLDEKQRVVYLAVRWACKEAIFKATQDKDYFKYTILNYESGKPYVLDYEKYKLSITHEGDYVTAIVIVE